MLLLLVDASEDSVQSTGSTSATHQFKESAPPLTCVAELGCLQNVVFCPGNNLLVATGELTFSLNCWTQDSPQETSTGASAAARCAKRGRNRTATPRDAIFVLAAGAGAAGYGGLLTFDSHRG